MKLLKIPNTDSRQGKIATKGLFCQRFAECFYTPGLSDTPQKDILSVCMPLPVQSSERHIYIYIYIYVYTHTYTYTYMCIFE